MNWALLAGSLVAVLALAATAWALRLGGGGIADAAAAGDEAEAAVPGFVAVRAIVGVDGAAAVVLGDDGRVVLLRRHGAHVVARTMTPDWSVDLDGMSVAIDTRERAGRCVVVLANAGDARELTAMLAKPPRA